MTLPRKLIQTVVTEIELLRRREDFVSKTIANAAQSGRNKTSQGKTSIIAR